MGAQNLTLNKDLSK